MAQKRYPNYPADTANGDDASFSPQKTQTSLLGTERGSDSTRRLETDVNNNLYVRVAADDSTPGGTAGVSPLATGAVTGVPATTTTTIVTFTAVVATRVTKISCGGTIYAKFQLFKNTVLFDTHRSGPDRGLELLFNPGLALAPGDILDVKLTHYQTGLMEDFEATVYGG